MGFKSGTALLAILTVGRTVPFVLGFFLGHVFALLGVSVPTSAGTVIDMGIRVDPDSD